MEGTKSLGQVASSAGNVVAPAIAIPVFPRMPQKGASEAIPLPTQSGGSRKELPSSPMAGHVGPSMNGGVAMTSTMDTRKGSHSGLDWPQPGLIMSLGLGPALCWCPPQAPL